MKPNNSPIGKFHNETIPDDFVYFEKQSKETSKCFFSFLDDDIRRAQMTLADLISVTHTHFDVKILLFASNCNGNRKPLN